MQKMALAPAHLKTRHVFAKKCGRPDAVRDLADLVESIGTSPLSKPMKARKAEKPSIIPAPREALAKEGAE